MSSPYLAAVSFLPSLLWATDYLDPLPLSTRASLFYLTAFGATDWLPLLPLVFVVLFFAVWVPCCTSDIVFPLLFRKGPQHH
jgi:hypothetical protein